MSKKKGLKGNGLVNFRMMVRKCGEMGLDRVYSVDTKCMCGRIEERMMMFRDWSKDDEHQKIKALEKEDKSPILMCSKCSFDIQEMDRAGIKDPKQVADLLGWNENQEVMAG